jgi:hypothetical protein
MPATAPASKWKMMANAAAVGSGAAKRDKGASASSAPPMTPVPISAEAGVALCRAGLIGYALTLARPPEMFSRDVFPRRKPVIPLPTSSGAR